MKALNIIIFLFTNLFYCQMTKNCETKCKKENESCLAQSILTININSATAIAASTRPTSQGSELEPNNTFQNSYLSTDNGLGAELGKGFILNAVIDSVADIDIFDVGAGSSGYRKLTIINGLDKVSCSIYKKNTLVRLQTATNIIDSTWIFDGNLTSPYSFSFVEGGVLVYLICSGNSSSSYSIKLDVDTSASSSGSITLKPGSEYSPQIAGAILFSTCTDHKKSCEKTCNDSQIK